MKAHEVQEGKWFMVVRTKQWFKRLPDTEGSEDIVRAGIIETPKVFYINKDEEVILDKK